ncbi:glycerate dehydrogenase [Hypnocyclicus thermotrophus]|uniref:Glycerate dehydrogenase n=1 Tax=Hypnocyclicus thermotrophus TaxID=1627895 RepID=A0AA46I682_9FUSO|nr:D-2-hydroxyacid dehydrogenase [Hypnocyclicus thermotrophus]TDT72220.1 glycerate dehydrogenase [Hypnocyclicus thermotrophus]
MKLVFLDAISLGNDIDLSIFNKFGEFKYYKTTSKEELFDRIKDVEVIITNKIYFGKEELKQAKKLKLIAITATGYNNVDLEEARKRNIKVCNVKGYSTNSVAQLTLTYILALATNICKYDKSVKEGEWSQSPIFTLLKYPMFDITDKTLGIIGYGEIGKKVEELAKNIGMKVLIAKRPGVNYEDDFRTEFKELIKNSDFITLHCPLSKDTKHLISYKEFDMMKSTSFLINIARGPVVDELALYKALKEKKIAGAAIDVMDSEPPKKENPLLKLDNILITPHIAWASIESRIKLINGVVKNIEDFINNKLINL